MADLVCGTGGWGGPKPGDPDNNLVLTATPAFGGIDVEWTYPGINPHAVSHTLLYRGTSDNYDFAVRHKVVSGNFFYDKTTSATAIEYFYWIQIVSINGTTMDPIGPASAIARPTIEQTILGLTNAIDNGMLSETLKQDIQKINQNYLDLLQEKVDRANEDAQLGFAFEAVQAQTDETRALLLQEVEARTDANQAFVTQLNTAQVSLGDDLASIQTELTATIDTFNGDLTTIGAQFSITADVNGLIGGFGLRNDGTIIEAGFDVDRFWIGRTGSLTQKKPFIVEGGEVFIDQAVINKLVFSKLRADDGSLIVEDGKLKAEFIEVSNVLQSDNWPAAGWQLTKAGSFQMKSASTGGRIERTANATKVYDANGVKRVQLGNLAV